MVMPAMNGRECFLALKKPNPHIRVLLSSGYGRNATTQEILDEGMCGFIQKPYKMDDIARIVAAALHGGGAPKP
jgi:two-component system, cell cycle sensor histidine kinase and response regulator CckA